MAEEIELNIEGMHCGACATGIQMVATGIDGVDEAFVDYDGKKGKFKFDPEKANKEQIIKAIEELGYKAS